MAFEDGKRGSTNDRVDRAAENAWLKIVGRVSMALLVPLFVLASTITKNYLDNIVTSQTTIKESFNAQDKAIALLSGRMDNFDNRLNSLVSSLDGIYRTSDATRDQRVVDVRLNDLDRRIAAMENQFQRRSSAN